MLDVDVIGCYERRQQQFLPSLNPLNFDSRQFISLPSKTEMMAFTQGKEDKINERKIYGKNEMIDL